MLLPFSQSAAKEHMLKTVDLQDGTSPGPCLTTWKSTRPRGVCVCVCVCVCVNDRQAAVVFDWLIDFFVFVVFDHFLGFRSFLFFSATDRMNLMQAEDLRVRVYTVRSANVGTPRRYSLDEYNGQWNALWREERINSCQVGFDDLSPTEKTLWSIRG